jgi:flagellar basal-body rod protein FlgF
MEGPTYVALSAQVALQRHLEVVANNVANTSTAGFKADRQLFQSYVSRLAVPGGSVSFMQDRATYIDQRAAELQPTGNPLDVAVQGEGFFGIATPQGTKYTRDGRMHVQGRDNTLVDAAGRAFLGDDGQPITLPASFTGLTVRADGSIRVTVDGRPQEVGRLGTFRPVDPMAMRKSGDGLLETTAGMTPIDVGDKLSSVVQQALEGSSVQPVVEIANMTELSRAYERLQTLLSDDNDRERRMIDALSRGG